MVETMIEHQPVLRPEVVQLLKAAEGGLFVDCTLGLGGHAEAILEASSGSRLIGIDRDSETLELARQQLLPFHDRIRLFAENFKNLPLILNRLEIGRVDGILVDLGVSSFQLLEPERGFSFLANGPLDMRMDRRQKLTAASLVNSLPESELADLFYRFGEEKRSRAIARAIGRERSKGELTTTEQLSRIVEKINPRATRIHPATRVFQALRIAVNNELHGLDEFIRSAVPFLKQGGRIAVIAFHSLEDRIVKVTFNELAGRCVCEKSVELCLCPREKVIEIITRKPVCAAVSELAANPRSRSARLRVAEKAVEEAA